MPSGPATPRPLRQLRAWLDDRPLDDANLAAYVGHLHQTGRSPATAAMAVAAVTRAASDAGEAVPVGPFTRHAIEGFRRTAAGDAPPRRGQARGLTADECATVLATCLRPRRTGRGLERPKTAERRGLIDGAIVALLFHGALRRSEVAALCWTDVDLADGDDVVVTVRRSEVRSDRGACGRAASGRRMRGRGPQPARGGLTGTRGFGRRPQRRPDQPPVRRRRRLRSSRPRGAENLARRPRRSRRRAHRPRSLDARHSAGRRLEGPRHGGTLRREHQHSRGRAVS